MNTACVQDLDARAVTQLTRTDEPLSYDISLPLVIDLDGTLIATDALHESLLFFIKRRGIASWKIPFWILAGRAIVKNRLAEAVTEEDVATFPANDEIVALAERESSRGRRVILATAADLSIAEKTKLRYPFIEDVIASVDGRNLKGVAKAEEVFARFPEGFIYVGDSTSDLHVWSKATAAIFAGRSAAMKKKITTRTELAAVLPTKISQLSNATKGPEISSMGQKRSRFRPPDIGRQGP